jgi:hypothetical protein
VKFSPVADENLFVYSCSSDKMGLFHFFSGFIDFPNLVPVAVLLPLLTEGANLILPGLFSGLPALLSGELNYDSLIPSFIFFSAYS